MYKNGQKYVCDNCGALRGYRFCARCGSRAIRKHVRPPLKIPHTVKWFIYASLLGLIFGLIDAALGIDFTVPVWKHIMHRVVWGSWGIIMFMYSASRVKPARTPVREITTIERPKPTHPVRHEPKFVPIPTYGDVMTIEEFRGAVDNGMFIDYDGSGHYARRGAEMDQANVLKPSHVKNGEPPPEWATSVVWFNR